MKALSGVLVLSLALASSVSADRRQHTIEDYAVMEDGSGSCRLLFRLDGVEPDEEVVVARARLSFVMSGQPAARSLRLCLCPVTSQWAPGTVSWQGWRTPGGDYDEELVAFADVDLAQGATEIFFDVTPTIREIVQSGRSLHGFLLSVRPEEGVGLAVGDATRFSGLPQGSLELSYRKVRPPRSGWSG
jgi:hypothetical protein